MITLPPGANCPIKNASPTFVIASQDKNAWENSGLVLIPVDEKRHPTGEPSTLYRETDWNNWFNSQDDAGCRLRLDLLPSGTTRLMVMIYVYSAESSIAHHRNVSFTVDGSARVDLPAGEMGDSAAIIAEFYLRGSDWKVRALNEGSAYGLAAFGRRIGLDISDRHPNRAPSDSDHSGNNDSDRCTSATGTGFAVSAQHVLTCAHVVKDMTQYRMRSLSGIHELELVMADETNDLALLRVVGNVSLTPVVFKEGPSISLGEPVVAVGYPLSNLTGGSVTVTQGGISALTGLRSDSSVLSFTAPIQPGSSGSPLFDMSGQVTGMVTSAIPTAQNMNFAVKACLAIAFLEAAHISPATSRNKPTRAAHDLVRDVQPSLWLIEVRA